MLLQVRTVKIAERFDKGTCALSTLILTPVIVLQQQSF